MWHYVEHRLILHCVLLCQSPATSFEEWCWMGSPLVSRVAIEWKGQQFSCTRESRSWEGNRFGVLLWQGALFLHALFDSHDKIESSIPKGCNPLAQAFAWTSNKPTPGKEQLDGTDHQRIACHTVHLTFANLSYPRQMITFIWWQCARYTG